MTNSVGIVRSDIVSQSVGAYSDSYFGGQMRDAMKVLKAKQTKDIAGLSAKDTVLYLGQGGFDTHSNQVDANGDNDLGSILGDMASNLAVLVQDLKTVGLYDDSVILLFSEFGRTVYENGTQGSSTVGTDHGHGSNTFVFGGAVQGGVVGDAPTMSSIADPDYNALQPTTDFRNIFGDIFRWMGIAPGDAFDDPSYAYSGLGIF